MGDGMLDLAALREIVDDPDPRAANARITGAYHRLSETMRAAVGIPDDLDWCGFAKWSSHTVGLEINHQTLDQGPPTASRGGTSRLRVTANVLTAQLLPDAVERIPWLFDGTRAAIREVLESLVAVEDGLARRALRAGNTTIFDEMGRAYVALLDRLGGVDTAGTDEEFAARVAADVVADGGIALPAPLTHAHLERAPTRYLEAALLLYLRAAAQPDPARRSELVLGGNVAFSRFEQNRADRLIAIGTCAPARAQVIAAVNAVEGRFPGEVAAADEARGMLEGAQHSNAVVRAVDHLVVGWLTQNVLFVELGPSPGPGLPGRRVRLGLPAEIPASPVVVTDPQVAELVAEQRRAADGVATDWLLLPYRMAVIVRYFAAFQRDPALRAAPPGSA